MPLRDFCAHTVRVLHIHEAAGEEGLFCYLVQMFSLPSTVLIQIQKAPTHLEASLSC